MLINFFLPFHLTHCWIFIYLTYQLEKKISMKLGQIIEIKRDLCFFSFYNNDRHSVCGNKTNILEREGNPTPPPDKKCALTKIINEGFRRAWNHFLLQLHSFVPSLFNSFKYYNPILIILLDINHSLVHSQLILISTTIKGCPRDVNG